MGKIKNVVIMITIGIIWMYSFTTSQGVIKILIGNHGEIGDLIAKIAGGIIAIIVIFLYATALLIFNVIKIDPSIIANVGDPYLDDPKWKDGVWHGNSVEAKNQNH